MKQISSTKQKTKRKAIVLSGGSIRGAFQAGALSAILKSGYQPDIIQGISSGALNGLYVVSEAGKTDDPTRWEQAGDNLRSFWMKHIRSPKDLVKKRILRGIFSGFGRNFRGLVNPSPLRNLLNEQIDLEAAKNCPAKFLVGASNLLDGNIEYKNQTEKSLIEFVLASAAMPIIFPPVRLDSKIYYDGGIRDNAPIKQVIEAGADEIIFILTQPEKMKVYSNKHFRKYFSFFPLADRIVNILLNDVLVNDLNELIRVNQDIATFGACLAGDQETNLHKKRIIEFKIIRPTLHYEAKINRFDSGDIHKMIMDGYQQGIQATYSPFKTGIPPIIA